MEQDRPELESSDVLQVRGSVSFPVLEAVGPVAANQGIKGHRCRPPRAVSVVSQDGGGPCLGSGWGAPGEFYVRIAES